MADESVGDGQKRRPPLSSIVPLPLRNWQVVEQIEVRPPVEIDGEATVVGVQPQAAMDVEAATDAADLSPAAPAAPSELSADQLDECMVVSLAPRQQQIAAGASAVYHLTLLNNGPERACFTTRLAESHATLWLIDSIPGVVLQPGERSTVAVELTPPKAATSRAGDHLLTFVVEAEEYPTRQSQVVATLTIAPFVEFTLGKISLPYRMLTWWRRSVVLTAPLRNSGNHPVTLFLRAQDGADACHVAFHAPRLRQIRPQQAMITIPPGRVTPVALHVYAQSQAWFGRSKRSCPLQLTVAAKAAPEGEQRALVKLSLAPVIGPWQVVALLGLFSFVVTGVGLGGLAMLIALIMNVAQPGAASQPMNVSAVPVAPPSIVTILVQPAVSAPGSASIISAAPPANSAATTAQLAANSQPEARDPNVPLVQPEQISAPNGEASITTPGSAQTVAPAALVTAASATTATAHTMTYAQMFQEVALRYDLNWRMLAAQAYVESSFDSLALGSHGDLGLMQIQPATWREWAPTVEASDPFDSYNNVLVAAVYLDYLRATLSKRGHSEREWMLVAYNWGPDKVLQHLEKGGTWDDLRPDLQQYVEDILRLAETIPPDAAF